jgi:hypothetical protein
MQPMFLHDVENNPAATGAFAELIERMRQGGQAFPQIWHLFAFKPELTKHLERFTQGVMREAAPLSPGLRELIAAYTSKRNDCPF